MPKLSVQCDFQGCSTDDELVSQVQPIMSKALNFLAQHGVIPDQIVNKNFEISVLFTDDHVIAQINQDWRNINQPTDVLSMSIDDINSFELNNFDSIMLGDIVIGLETCIRESKEDNIPFEEHLIRLLVHGLIHILGYDHQSDSEALVMQELEHKVINHLGCSHVGGITNNYFSPIE